MKDTYKTIRLYSRGLLSKWGFSDGDILSDFIYENDLDFKLSEHKLLESLIKRHLLPKLNHKIEVCFMMTNHNPVRAEMIDGVDYSNWYEDDEWDTKLQPEFVEITYDQILEEVQKFLSNSSEGSN